MIRALGLALVLAACGREIHHGVDAPPADSPSDIDAVVDNGQPPAGAVTLTVTRLSAPVGGITVVFQSADSVIQTSVTDATGRAWALMPDGGFVTAIEHIGPGSDDLTTFANVVAGDSLRLDATPILSGTNGEVAIGVPIDSNVITSSYAIQTSCGGGAADNAGSGTVQLENCGSTFDVVVLGLDADGVPTGNALVAENVSTTPPITVTGTLASFESVSLNYINVPSQISLVSTVQGLSATRLAYQISDSVAPSGGAAAVAFKRPSTAGSVLTMTTLFPTTGTGEIGQQYIYDWDNAATTAKNIDLATSLLHAYATAPVYDKGTHAVSWTERTPGLTPDAMRVLLQIYRDDIPAGYAWRWKLAGARGTDPSITFPTLPTVNGFDFNPAADDTVGISDLTGLRLPGGLAPWRASIFAPIPHAITGAAGHITVQSLYEEQL